MEYNLAGLRDRVRIDKLDDEEFDPTIIDNFINDTQRDIFNEYELPFQEKIFSGAIPAGSAMFNFPTDCAQIQSQVVTAPDGSQTDIKNGYMDFRTFNKNFPTPNNNEAAPISYWTLYAQNMLLSQPTDQAYTMNTFYIKKPTLLTDNGDVPDVPEEFGELLVLGAFKRVLERNEDYDLAAVVNQQYNNLLNMLVARYGYRHADGPIKMKNQQRRVR
jgi:hypothetical protein